jgi:hypothetical protein
MFTGLQITKLKRSTIVAKKKKEATERNQIEGKFEQGKNGYDLNRIRAKLKDTSESWVSAIFFIMNLICIRDRGIIWSKLFCFISLFSRRLPDFGFVKTDIGSNSFCNE